MTTQTRRRKKKKKTTRRGETAPLRPFKCTLQHHLERRINDAYRLVYGKEDAQEEPREEGADSLAGKENGRLSSLMMESMGKNNAEEMREVTGSGAGARERSDSVRQAAAARVGGRRMSAFLRTSHWI